MMSTAYPICRQLGFNSDKYVNRAKIEKDIKLYPSRITKDFRRMYIERWTPRQIRSSWVVADWKELREEIGGLTLLQSGLYEHLIYEMVQIAEDLPEKIEDYFLAAGRDIDQLDEDEDSTSDYAENQ